MCFDIHNYDILMVARFLCGCYVLSRMEKRYNLNGKKERTCVSSDWLMTDWLMDKYVSLSSFPQLDPYINCFL